MSEERINFTPQGVGGPCLEIPDSIPVGPLVVHRAIGYIYPLFSVSHRATGYALGEPFLTEEEAVKAAQECIRGHLELWDFKTLEEFKSRKSEILLVVLAAGVKIKGKT